MRDGQPIAVSLPPMTISSIFISSVQKELAEERRAVKAFVEGDALLRRYFTAFLFEDLPAADARADAVYLEQVDMCRLRGFVRQRLRI